MTKTLTDRFVAGIRSATRENYFDTKTRGLVLRVSPRAKVWYFTYRNGGPSQWLKIGDYPAVSLADARTTALDHRHSIDVEGKDPAAERRTPAPDPPTSFTFADFIPTFIAFQKGRVKTWRDDRNEDREVSPASVGDAAPAGPDPPTRPRAPRYRRRPGPDDRRQSAAGAHQPDLHGGARPRAD